MAHMFNVGFTMISARTGEMFSSAPVIPIRIMAESPAEALEEFAHRSEGAILETSKKSNGVEAKVSVDGRVFRVKVSAP